MPQKVRASQQIDLTEASDPQLLIASLRPFCTKFAKGIRADMLSRFTIRDRVTVSVICQTVDIRKTDSLVHPRIGYAVFQEHFTAATDGDFDSSTKIYSISFAPTPDGWKSLGGKWKIVDSTAIPNNRPSDLGVEESIPEGWGDNFVGTGK